MDNPTESMLTKKNGLESEESPQEISKFRRYLPQVT